MSCVRVLIVDRHPVVLQGLHSLLAAEKDFTIVASCCGGRDGIQAIRALRPDVALVDMFLPDVTSHEMLVNANRFHTRVILLAEFAEDCEQILAVARGAYGVVLKDAVPAILVHSVRQVASGQKLLPSAVAQHYSEGEHSFGGREPGQHLISHLTDRERQIVHFVSEGLSNKAIGRRLNISHGTIKVHLHHIFQKLGTINRATLIALAFSDPEFGRPPQRDKITGEALPRSASPRLNPYESAGRRSAIRRGNGSLDDRPVDGQVWLDNKIKVATRNRNDV